MAVERIRIATTPNTSDSDYIISNALMVDSRFKVYFSGTNKSVTATVDGVAVTSPALVESGKDIVLTSETAAVYKWVINGVVSSTATQSITVPVSADSVIVNQSADSDYTKTDFADTYFVTDTDEAVGFSCDPTAQTEIQVNIAGTNDDPLGDWSYSGQMTWNDSYDIYATDSTVTSSLVSNYYVRIHYDSSAGKWIISCFQD